MPTVLLVRHGQASYGADDYDVLSERGHRQSAAVAQALAARGIRPALVVAGSLRRQRDTAAPVLEAAGVELGVDPAWNEYDSDDVLTHHSDSGVRMDRTDAPADAPQVSSRRFQEILDAALLDWIAAGTDSSADETWPAFVSRATAGLERVVAQLESGQTAVVSTSGGVIGVLAATLLNVPAPAFVAFNRVCVNGSISKLITGGRGTTLLTFNEQGHVDAEGADMLTYR